MKRFARPHVPEEELHAYADNQLSGGQRAEIAEHLMGCLICRAHHAEVRDLRVRTSEILSIAVPRIPAALQATGPAAAKSQRENGIGWRSALSAAAVAAAVVGSWMIQRDDTKTAARAALANVFVAPALFASNAPTAVDGDQRALELANRSTVFPRIATTGTPPAPMARRLSLADPMADFTPSTGWEAISWEDAVRLGDGSLARLHGLPITAVRIGRTESGARPTMLVRHQLPDGRSAWVIEGTEAGIATVYAVLEASGLSLSTPVRTRPDYLGTSAQQARTVRMVTVAAYMSADSLQALVGTLKMR